MRLKIHTILFLLFLTLVSPAPGTYSQERSRPMPPIVRQVDHIMILTRNPDSLYSFLVNLLVGLRTLRGAFLCEYNFDVAGRRKACQQELGRRGGGPIGLQRVKEIVLGVTELDDAIARWQKVLDPLRPDAAGFWRVGDGPALRLILSDRAGIQRLVLEVKSLDQATGFLARHNLLGTRSKDEIKIDAKGVQGLDLRLVAAAP